MGIDSLPCSLGVEGNAGGAMRRGLKSKRNTENQILSAQACNRRYRPYGTDIKARGGHSPLKRNLPHLPVDSAQIIMLQNHWPAEPKRYVAGCNSRPLTRRLGSLLLAVGRCVEMKPSQPQARLPNLARHRPTTC